MSSDNVRETIQPQSVRVLAAVIQRGNNYLVCQRPLHKRHGGFWEFPGGKLEAGEDIERAAIRELAEELGVRVTSVSDVVYRTSDPNSAFVIEFAFVECEGEPVALEHDALLWQRLELLPCVALAPSDRAFVEWFLREKRQADTRT